MLCYREQTESALRSMMLKLIEEFFRVREPASPIPILLFKARNMLSKDFHSLVRELIPPVV